MTGRSAASRRAVAASDAAGVGLGRLELGAVTVKSMNELKRSRVVDGKIRTITNAQYGRLLQFIIEQAHDAALAVFVERGRRFVEKDQPGLCRRRANARRSCSPSKLLVPALCLVELGNETAEIAPLKCFSSVRIGESVGGARIAQGVAYVPSGR